MSRLDLRLVPGSGAALPVGDEGTVTWTAPEGAVSAFFLVGSVPGIGDLWPVSGSPALALNEPIPVPIRAAGPTFVLGVVELSDLTREATIAQYRPLNARESLWAAAERMVRSYFLNSWLGVDRSSRLWCPVVVASRADEQFAVSGPDAVASCYPWTPDEVRAEIGYAVVTVEEYDRQPDNIAAGADAQGNPTSGVLLWLRFAVELAVPARSRGAADVLEQRRAEIERLFTGLALLEQGPPRVEVRQLAERPVRDAQIGSDSTWLRRGMVAPMRAYARIPQIGTR